MWGVNRLEKQLNAQGYVLEEEWLKARFGFPTGKEAYRPGPEEPIYIRPTHNVGVLIRHDNRSKRGYRVLTAYPLNARPGKGE